MQEHHMLFALDISEAIDYTASRLTINDTR